jgi:hypothetical protein
MTKLFSYQNRPMHMVLCQSRSAQAGGVLVVDL